MIISGEISCSIGLVDMQKLYLRIWTNRCGLSSVIAFNDPTGRIQALRHPGTKPCLSYRKSPPHWGKFQWIGLWTLANSMQSASLRPRGFKFLDFLTPLSTRLISMSADPQLKAMPSALTLHHHAKCSVRHAMPNSNAPLLCGLRPWLTRSFYLYYSWIDHQSSRIYSRSTSWLGAFTYLHAGRDTSLSQGSHIWPTTRYRLHALP